MKLRNTLIWLLCACMLIPLLAACKPENPDPITPESSSQEQTTPPEDTTEDPGDDPEVPKDAIQLKKEELAAIQSTIGATTDTVLYVKDFGAKGDGTTDDGAAIYAAICAAIEQHATLKFEENKTYYVASAPAGRVTPFTINDAHGVTIDGCGATVLIAPNMRYLYTTNSGNIKVTNFHFDYAVPVYLVGKVIAVNDQDVTFSVDQNPYMDSYNFASQGGFSIMYNEGTQSRPHMFMGRCVKTGDKQITVTYPEPHHYKVGNTVFVPNPGIGHAANQVFDIRNSDQPMLFENIGVHAASTFVWGLFSNTDHIFFENVDLVPAQSNQREIKMVSWRDGYHCKNNTAGIHWNNCEADVLFDDVFNISATLGVVSAVDGNTSFDVKNYEVPADIFTCSPGDTVDIYDLAGGLYKGCARVRSVTDNPDGSRKITLFYGETIENVTTGCVVANRDTAAPGSTITNCHFEGTFRFLRNLYVENTVFDQLVTWMMVEGSVEGPLPGNVDFVNCTFNGGEVQIDAYNRNTNKRMKKIGEKIVDIGFWGCTFNNSRVKGQTGATYTIQDTYVVDELFTVKNSANTGAPQIIAPTKSDLDIGVTWDWSMTTMAITGNATITALKDLDKALSNKLDAAKVGTNVLALSAAAGEKLYFDSISASALPDLYKKGETYLINLTYYTDTPVKANLVIGGVVVAENVFATTGALTTTTLLYDADGSAKIAYIEYADNGTVYLGEFTIATFANANPSISQLEAGHTFVWNKTVKIDGGQAIAVDDITDEAAKKAILENPDKFGKTVMHLDRAMGEFSGLTQRNLMTTGTTYKISIDAYIASPISPGTTMYLLAIDSTPGNRVLKEGIFEGEGLYHFEMNWTIGNTGEIRLAFFVNGSPANYADIYVGNLTLTRMPGMAPNKTIMPDQIYQVSKSELSAGFTYDFSKGQFFQTNVNSYVDMSCLNDYTKECLQNAGFGEYAYYYNENIQCLALSNPVYGGQTYRLTLRVYDCKGNLKDMEADGTWRGAFVMLNMTGGGQNSAEVRYIIEPDPNYENVYTIVFTDNVPTGTDMFLLYQIHPCEFYISSIKVQIR